MVDGEGIPTEGGLREDHASLPAPPPVVGLSSSLPSPTLPSRVFFNRRFIGKLFNASLPRERIGRCQPDWASDFQNLSLSSDEERESSLFGDADDDDDDDQHMQVDMIRPLQSQEKVNDTPRIETNKAIATSSPDLHERPQIFPYQEQKRAKTDEHPESASVASSVHMSSESPVATVHHESQVSHDLQMQFEFSKTHTGPGARQEASVSQSLGQTAAASVSSSVSPHLSQSFLSQPHSQSPFSDSTPPSQNFVSSSFSPIETQVGGPPPIYHNVVPKSALYSIYGKKPRRTQISNSDYFTWHDNALPHMRKYTAIFLDPRTKEKFFSGRYGDPLSFQSKDGAVWYTKKTLAEHAAAARAYDCLMLRDSRQYDQSVMNGYKKVSGGRRLTLDEPYEMGHAPQEPVIPMNVESKLIEASTGGNVGDAKMKDDPTVATASTASISTVAASFSTPPPTYDRASDLLHSAQSHGRIHHSHPPPGFSSAFQAPSNFAVQQQQQQPLHLHGPFSPSFSSNDPTSVNHINSPNNMNPSYPEDPRQKRNG